ncbi:MAG: tyrosine-type recombinase/integrase [Candidatus Caenarcaniphilales bacterium]|nr:tyrosine-type recombinase/integrase [Candidatus Caenarcaniphilales bacterium]
MEYISACEIAKDLRVSERTVQNYCKEGFINAVKDLVGRKQYIVKLKDYYEWKDKFYRGRGKIIKKIPVDQDLSKNQIKTMSVEWLDWCKTGKLNGRPIGPRTLEIYEYYFKEYLKKLGKNYTQPVISVDNLRTVLGDYAPKSYSTKAKIYDSILSFSKYLIEKKLFSEAQKQELRKLKPKRVFPPKRTVITEAQYREIIGYIEKSTRSVYNKVLTKALVVMIVNTGLRAMEISNLKIEDVDLVNGIASVWLGKGNKNRKVGLNQEVIETLQNYLSERLKANPSISDSFFTNAFKAPLCRDAIVRKFHRLSKSCGIEFSAHGLRRTFATLSSNRGKPLNHLRRHCKTKF